MISHATAEIVRRSIAILIGAVWLSGVSLTTTAVSAQDIAGSPNEQESPRLLDETNSLGVRFPTTKVNSLGWTMRVRFSSLRTADTMRVEIDFATTGGPTTADQNLEVRLVPIETGHAPPQSSLRVALPIRIAEGTRQIRFVRHVPKSSYGDFYEVLVFEEGRKVPGCEYSVGSPITNRDSAVYANQREQQLWRVLWVESDADDATRTESMRLYAMTFAQPPFYVGNSPQQWEQVIESGGGNSSFLHFAGIAPDELPHDWRALRSFDTIMMHRGDWSQMSDSRDAAAVAVRRWVQAGGTVIVRDADPKLDDTAPDAAYTSPSPEFINQAIHNSEMTAYRYEQYARQDSELFANDIRYSEINPDEVEVWRKWFPDAVQTIRQSLTNYSLADVRSASGVRARSELGGTIIFLGRQDSRPIQILQWAAVGELLSWRRYRLVRNGVDPILGSQRFFQWVIPGVSEPPVYTFMGLLGVFVVLVGPIAYRKTAKAGRSYLMFAIAPILAIATTAAMLGYGVIADGFGTRVRSRQITWVDGTRGEAFTRTRSTYFAGIRPSEGLVFPPDSEISLYPDNQGRSWESRVDERFETRGEVTVSDEAIRFSREFLPSRQQRQFVVHRAIKSWGRLRLQPDPQATILEVAQPEDSDIAGDDAIASAGIRVNGDNSEILTGPETVLVQSETDAALSELILCDTEGRYYFVESISPNATQKAWQITRKEASLRMGEMYKREWLISTVTQRRDDNRFNSNNEITDLIADQLAGIDSPTKPSEGLFEFELQQRMQLQSDLPPGSFLGLAELTTESVAIDEAEVTNSIHYVMGSLP